MPHSSSASDARKSNPNPSEEGGERQRRVGGKGRGWDGCVRFHLFTLFCIYRAQAQLLGLVNSRGTDMAVRSRLINPWVFGFGLTARGRGGCDYAGTGAGAGG